VQQMLGEARGKRDAEVLDANATVSSPNTEVVYCSLGNTSRMGNQGGVRLT
jgi:hypothetical protein